MRSFGNNWCAHSVGQQMQRGTGEQPREQEQGQGRGEARTLPPWWLQKKRGRRQRQRCLACRQPWLGPGRMPRRQRRRPKWHRHRRELLLLLPLLLLPQPTRQRLQLPAASVLCEPHARRQLQLLRSCINRSRSGSAVLLWRTRPSSFWTSCLRTALWMEMDNRCLVLDCEAEWKTRWQRLVL